jgi:hypothetical protein
MEGVSRQDLVADWRGDLEDAERARLVAEELLGAEYAPSRMAGFEVLELIGQEVAAPYVRQLLDSPSSEAAAARHVTDPRFADLIRAAEQYHHEVLAGGGHLS